MRPQPSKVGYPIPAGRALGAIVAALALGGCASFSDFSLNPLDWFGRSAPPPHAPSQKSPHKGKEGDKKTCAFCHAGEPKQGEPVKFTKGIVELCDFCHAATKGGHFLLVNPFADPNLTEQVKAAKLPLYKGDYTCVSCHNPQGGTGEEKFLRKDFVALALQSRRVRPHFMKAFCEACHSVRPKHPKGSPEAQKLAEIPLRDTDMNKLCNRCHESGLSKANTHPIKTVVEPYLSGIPKNWPLSSDGQLTCLTCHTAGDPAAATALESDPLRLKHSLHFGSSWSTRLV